MELHRRVDSVLALHLLVPGLILSVPKIFSPDVADIYGRHCLEEWTVAR